MGQLIIRPGTEADVDVVQAISNDAKSLPFLGGWAMRDSVSATFAKNDKYPLHVVAELDGEVVGFSNSKDKNIRYTEYDLVAVNPDFRRQGIATAMYTYHLYRGALTGKYLMRDFTNHFNVNMQEGFLPTLGFEKIASLRNRGRNFSSANWWSVPISIESLDRFTKNKNSFHSAGTHDITFQGLEESFSIFEKIFTEALGTITPVIQDIESVRRHVYTLL